MLAQTPPCSGSSFLNSVPFIDSALMERRSRRGCRRFILRTQHHRPGPPELWVSVILTQAQARNWSDRVTAGRAVLPPRPSSEFPWFILCLQNRPWPLTRSDPDKGNLLRAQEMGVMSGTVGTARLRVSRRRTEALGRGVRPPGNRAKSLG